MPDSAPANTIFGRNAFIASLLGEGVTRMFGNPGTTELPIMHALSDYPEMGYVLAMQAVAQSCATTAVILASSNLAASIVAEHGDAGERDESDASGTPAVCDNELFIRTGEFLYCVSE